MPDKSRPGIAFVVAGLGAGGAERVIALLASAFVDDGRAVTVIAFDREDDPVYHDFDPGVRLLRLGGQPRGAASVVGRVRRLRAVLRAERFGVVISFLTKINVVTLLAMTGLGVPVIACERNNPQRQAGHPAWQFLLHRLYPRAAAIVLQTEASRACLPAAVARAANVIPNPVAVFGGVANESTRTLVAVGRFEHQKGFDLLLPAFAIVAQNQPEWRLAIWGDGPLRDAIAAQTRALGLEARVTLPGLSKTPGGWLAGAGAFVLSSRHEGFPNALGEAMAAGLPVVAFDCPFGPAEMICNDVNGLLVADGDAAALAAAMARLLGDAELRLRLGAAARLSARNFAPEAIFGQWHALEAGVRSGGVLPVGRHH
nr:glycosyltransferase family 4 protein [Polymorphobacter sp.]